MYITKQNDIELTEKVLRYLKDHENFVDIFFEEEVGVSRDDYRMAMINFFTKDLEALLVSRQTIAVAKETGKEYSVDREKLRELVTEFEKEIKVG